MGGKKSMVFVLGSTASHAFSLGTMLIGLERHISISDYDVLVISDDLHAGNGGRDAEIISGFRNCRIAPYEPLFLDRAKFPGNYPFYVLWRLEIFRLLENYRTAVWIDSDVAVQGDLAALTRYGPLAMAPSDNSFLRYGVKYAMARNFFRPEEVSGYDMDAPFYNAGVLVARDDLPRPLKFYEWCLRTIEEMHPNMRHNDQTALNMLAQNFPDLFQSFPAELYNCYPLNPASLTARIVHSCGARKFWNDGLLRLCFPEWHRDYLQWLAYGGSAYTGPVTDAAFIGRGTYPLVFSLVEKLNSLLENK